MIQSFFTDTLITRMIKGLLWDRYLPICNIWKTGKPIIKDFTYITSDKYIVKALRNYNPTTDIEGPRSSLDPSFFKKLGEYTENNFYPGITTRFRSNSALYDANTHYYLGQYLRQLRDLHDIDLMSLYNCFAGETSDKIRLDNNILNNTNAIDDGYITYIVPIHFNEIYSIYVNSTIPFKIRPAYYDGTNAIAIKASNNEDIGNTVVHCCSMDHPFIYGPINNINATGNIANVSGATPALLEDYLVILIQLPATLPCPIIIEGKPITSTINKNDNILKVTQQFVGKDTTSISNFNDIFNSPSSMTASRENKSIAFSDTLFQYLLLNPIIPDDKVRDNILRIQDALSSPKAKEIFGVSFDEAYIKDIWSRPLQAFIYDLVTQLKQPLCYDIKGYVDKDVEAIIDKAQTNRGVFNV